MWDPSRETIIRFGKRVSQLPTASATGHSRQKVTEVIQKAKARQLSYPLTNEMTDQWLEEFLFPEKTMEGSDYRPLDFDYIHNELGKKGVNLKLLHH